ncbi:branched-chain amino acid transporter permease [Saccharopolyspora griseoalba]|uniref:Branched-chain amino acid transporter permease n=1 Tax=Saccharopolyspora griseoalba TaxID=1431848 RepID=A0ABW2LU05_9PSEU
MPEPSYLIALVLLSAGITWALRALPFAALAPLRSSAAVHYLSERMPVGVMIILVIYTLHDLALAAAPAAGIALAATVGLHLWKRNALLSIFGGTAVHVALTMAL